MELAQDTFQHKAKIEALISVETTGAVRPRYVDALMRDVGTPEALKPPVPPLTRYKRDVAVKLQSEGPLRQYGSTRPASMFHTKCATYPLSIPIFGLTPEMRQA